MRSDLALAREQVVASSDQQTISSAGPARPPSSPTPRAFPTVWPGAGRRGLQLHVNAARAALDAGQLDDALDAAEQALILDPDEPRAVDLVERVRHAIDPTRS